MHEVVARPRRGHEHVAEPRRGHISREKRFGGVEVKERGFCDGDGKKEERVLDIFLLLLFSVDSMCYCSL